MPNKNKIQQTKRYYPRLSSILSIEDIPDTFGFVKDGIDKLFKKIHYKDLQYNKSPRGDAAFYSLSIISKKRLAIEIPGTGIYLVLNPNLELSTTSAFPITVEYEWKVLAYLRSFNLQQFSFSPQDFFQLALRVLNLSEEQAIANFINTFVEPLNEATTALEQFVKDVNKQHNLKLKAPKVTTKISDIVTEIYTKSGDYATLIAFTTYIVQNDLQETKNKLKTFFRSLIPQDIEEYIKDILIPKAKATLTLSAGMEFPRKILTPVYDKDGKHPLDNKLTGDPYTAIAADAKGDPKVMLTFGEALFYASTDDGFGSTIDLVLNTTYPAMIGKTGLIIDIQNVKIDLSRKENILEADLDNRSPEFIGAYIEEAAIILPPKWFKNQDKNTTLGIFARNMLVGTGGVTGSLALEAVGDKDLDILWVNIGKNDGFKVGFESFDIEFQQNKVTSSNLAGAMEIKKFVYPKDYVDDKGNNVGGQPVFINVTGHLDDNDFLLTTSTEPAFPIELPNVFVYHIKSLELGKEDDDFFIGTKGKLEFQGFLKDTLKLQAIEIEKLRIYSDGSIEFEGGSISLTEPVVLALGPVEITVTAISYGSIEKEVDGTMRKFNYFGFDGGISVDPLGVEVRGDGVKYFYCNDGLPNKPPGFLKIQTLYIDLTIPENSPAAIIKGWLTIPEPGVSPEYAGGIDIKIPKAKISGKADMKLMPKYPAFIIDATIALPAPIPLGPVSIYEFRGLIGYRYVAEKSAVGLTSEDKWYDYYKAEPRGIHVKKFNGPDRTTSSGKPFSIGVGATFGTSFDKGKVFNIKAMLVLSIPSLFIIDGRAAILAERTGLDDTDDPPFYAYLAVGGNSFEFGFGADFKVPKKNGKIMDLFGEVQAYFANNSSRWYVNIGSKTSQITAKVLTMFTLKSYLMISNKGIEAAARGEFNFDKKFGPARVSAYAHLEIGGKISFEKPQIGAYLDAEIGAKVSIKIASASLNVGVIFGVEAPKPFRIYGKFFFRIKVRIAFIKIRFKGDIELSWEFNKNVDRDPINPMIGADTKNSSLAIQSAVKGVNMLTNETFDLAYWSNSKPPKNLPNSFKNTIIPLDTYIDFKTQKALNPNPVSDKIGGVNNPAKGYLEKIPPQKTVKGKSIRQVVHKYSIESVIIKSWNTKTSKWMDYDPWKALYADDDRGVLDSLKIGQFQKSDGKYNHIRLLATTPFSYTEQGQPAWFIPEQLGTTAGTLFCEGEKEVKRRADFSAKLIGKKYTFLHENKLPNANGVYFYLRNTEEDDFAVIINESNTFGFPKSLRFDNTHILEIRLPEPSVEVNLKLSTYSQGVTIRFYASIIDDATSVVEYIHPNPAATNKSQAFEMKVKAAALTKAVEYNKPNWLPVTHIEVDPNFSDGRVMRKVTEQIARRRHHNNLIKAGVVKGKAKSTITLEKRLSKVKQVGYSKLQRIADTSKAKPIARKGIDKQKGRGKVLSSRVITTTKQNSNDCPQEVLSSFLKKQILPLFRSFSKPGMTGTEAIKKYKKYCGTLKHRLTLFNKKNPGCGILRKYPLLIQYANAYVKAPKDDLIAKIKWELNLLMTSSPGSHTNVNESTNGNGSSNNSGPTEGDGSIDNSSGSSTLCPPEALRTFHSQLRGVQNCFQGQELTDENFSDQYMVCCKRLRDAVIPFDRNNPGCEILANFPLLMQHVNTYLNNQNADLIPKIKWELGRLMDYVNNPVDTGEGNGNPIEIDEEVDENTIHCPPAAVCQLHIRLKEILPLFDVNTDVGPGPRNQDAFNAEVVEVYIDSFNRSNPKCKILRNFPDLYEAIIAVMTNQGIDAVRKLSSELGKFVLYLNRLGNCSNIGIPDTGGGSVDGNCPPDEICKLYYNLKDKVLFLHVDKTVNFEDVIDRAHNIKLSIIKFDLKYPSCGILNDFQLIPDQLQAFIDDPGKYTLGSGRATKLKNALVKFTDYLKEKGDCVEVVDPDPEVEKSHTLLHEVCWLSVDAHQFNLNIPSQAAIQADSEAAVEGMTQFIQPIWRPNTSYLVSFHLKDLVDNKITQDYHYNFGFTTAGPVGYFHNDPRATYGDYIDENRKKVEDAVINPDKYALTNLSQYIDYERSYPKANGNLLSAKPLFYDNETTEISLFFIKTYARHFFHDWGTYNGQAVATGKIKIEIKDPREGDAEKVMIYEQMPETSEDWEADENPPLPHVFKKIQNLLGATDCVVIGRDTTKAKPKSEKVKVVLTNLRPQKLYTAIVFNLFGFNKNVMPVQDANKKREVHRFTFQTSRYASFKEQVESYLLTDDDPENLETKPAIFDIKSNFKQADIRAAYDTIIGKANAKSDALAIDLQHRFDRIIEGIFRLDPLPPPISTEFNLVKNNKDKIIAIIIRNPEPFNMPSIPLDELKDTIQLLDNNGNVQDSFEILFSKDCSQAIIMHKSLGIPPGQFNFKFTFKLWDGDKYIIPGTEHNKPGEDPKYTSDEVGTIVINNLELS